MNTTDSGLELKQAGIALLAIRIAAALAFLYHGSGMLFGWFGEPGLAGFASHAHMPLVVAALVGLAEFCGGLAMLTGVLARLGAACIILVMLGAILLVHLPHGFDSTKGGYEYPLTQLLIAVAVLVAGAGPYTLAYLFDRSRSRGNSDPYKAPPIAQP